jgi:hypothetical protein
MKQWKLGNYSSEIIIRNKKDKYIWKIKDYSGEKEVEIPQSLYKELRKFENTEPVEIQDLINKL